MEWINTVEFANQSAMIIRSSGPFTKSICKMWVKDRHLCMGVKGAYLLGWLGRGRVGGVWCGPLTSLSKHTAHLSDNYTHPSYAQLYNICSSHRTVFHPFGRI
jgi:hypothetical protein